MLILSVNFGFLIENVLKLLSRDLLQILRRMTGEVFI